MKNHLQEISKKHYTSKPTCITTKCFAILNALSNNTSIKVASDVIYINNSVCSKAKKNDIIKCYRLGLILTDYIGNVQLTELGTSAVNHKKKHKYLSVYVSDII